MVWTADLRIGGLAGQSVSEKQFYWHPPPKVTAQWPCLVSSALLPATWRRKSRADKGAEIFIISPLTYVENEPMYFLLVDTNPASMFLLKYEFKSPKM